jgi:hypothetical protein
MFICVNARSKYWRKKERGRDSCCVEKRLSDVGRRVSVPTKLLTNYAYCNEPPLKYGFKWNIHYCSLALYAFRLLNHHH